MVSPSSLYSVKGIFYTDPELTCLIFRIICIRRYQSNKCLSFSNYSDLDFQLTIEHSKNKIIMNFVNEVGPGVLQFSVQEASTSIALKQ